jgi:hypothetical protein
VLIEQAALDSVIVSDEEIEGVPLKIESAIFVSMYGTEEKIGRDGRKRRSIS